MKRSNLQKKAKHTLVLGCENILLFWGVKTYSCFGVWKRTHVLGCENVPMFWGVKTYPCFGVCGRKNFFMLSPSYAQSPNSSLRMFWYRDLNSSHFFPHFGALEHAANRTPDISAPFVGSRNKACKRNRMSVCPARKRKPSILSLSCRLNGFNRCSRGRTTLLQILCQNMVRTWYTTQ